MGAHWHALRYLWRHKIEVARAGRALGVPWWLLLIHDWSKLRPSEWFGYVRYFRPGATAEDKAAGHTAFQHHYARNLHHWQRWCRITESGVIEPLPMPERYVREMVADWIGAGRATGNPDTRAWYADPNRRLLLHPETRALVERLLAIAPSPGAL